MPETGSAEGDGRSARQAPGDPAGFTSQLISPELVFDVRPRRRPAADNPVGLARQVPGGQDSDSQGPGGRLAPSVLLLSRCCDAELDSVRALLGSVGVPAERVNADELASLDLEIDLASRGVRINGRWLAPTVTWMRHFSAHAVEEGAAGLAYGMFLRASWQAVAGQIAAISATCIRQRRPALLAQLLLAGSHQVAVPRTIVTTDLGSARAAFDCPRLIVKAVDEHFVEAEPGRLTGIFPVIVERRDLPRGRCHGPPVVVQEYVEHDTELRSYYAAGQIHVFEVSKDSPACPWSDPERVRVRRVDPPSAVASATRVLASAMALRFGAFDFLVRDGTPVFLEANPDGDWRWAERGSRSTVVTLAAARMLAELHHGARRATPRAMDRGASPLDLLAFLSAT